MSCGIYKITNLVNGHSYIGQSIDIARRWRAHRSYNKTEVGHRPLYRAFEKYGLDNFSFEIIEECDKKFLNEREQYWINYYDTFYNGYNLTEGGDGTVNTIVKLTNNDVDDIIQLLKENELTQRYIAQMFKVGEDTISEINWGKTRRRTGISYPIRQFNQQKTICPICGNKKDRAAKLCSKCNYAKLKEGRPNREELKNLIRNTAFIDIGIQFNVSDNTIRRWCDGYKLPRHARKIKKYTDEEWDKI